MRRFSAVLVAGLTLLGSPAALADQFQRIDEADGFVKLVAGKSLTRFGIRLEVAPNGNITGRAFGRPVTGTWEWSSDGYFCRDLAFGQRQIALNCQTVLVDGKTIRFIADRGAGDTADLVIR